MKQIIITRPLKDIAELLSIDEGGAEIHYKGKTLIAYPKGTQISFDPPQIEKKPVEAKPPEVVNTFIVNVGTTIINLQPVKSETRLCEETSIHPGLRIDEMTFKTGYRDGGTLLWTRFLCKSCIAGIYERSIKYGGTLVFFDHQNQILI